MIEVGKGLLENVLEFREVISNKIFSLFPLNFVSWILISFCDLSTKMDWSQNTRIEVVNHLLIETRPRIIDQNHHVDDFFIKIDCMIIMFDFIEEIEDIGLDDFLLIFWNWSDVILRWRIPSCQHVVF